MWPVVMALLRRNAVYITLPVAAVVGFVGYNLESILSDKYTPYSRECIKNTIKLSHKFNDLLLLVAASIQEIRAKRLTEESAIENAANVEKLQLKCSVLERNLSPSLQPKKNDQL